MYINKQPVEQKPYQPGFPARTELHAGGVGKGSMVNPSLNKFDGPMSNAAKVFVPSVRKYDGPAALAPSAYVPQVPKYDAFSNRFLMPVGKG